MNFKNLNDNQITITDTNGEEIFITIKENMIINSSVFGKYHLGKKLFYISIFLLIILTVINKISNPSEIEIPKSEINGNKTWFTSNGMKYQPNGKYTSIYEVLDKEGGGYYYSKNVDFYLFQFLILLFCFPFGIYGFIQYKKWKSNFENNNHNITLSINSRGIGQISEISNQTFFVGNFDETKKLFEKLSTIIKTKKFN